MRAQQHRADNTSRATAKLAELQARGLCAPPPEPSAAQTAIVDRQSVDAVAVRSARAQVVGVVVPAYLSIEELLVKSGVNALQEVALSMPPMPLHVSCPKPTSGKEHHRRNDGSAPQRPFTDTGESGTPTGTDSAGWGTDATKGTTAAVTAALAAMAAMRGVPPARQPPDAAASAPRPPKLPPPGFATAGSTGTRTDAEAPRDSVTSSNPLEPAQSNSALTLGPTTNLTGAAMSQTHIPLLAPSSSIGAVGNAAGTSGAIDSTSTGNAAATDASAVVGAQQRSCPTPPRTPQPQEPTATAWPPHTPAADTTAGKACAMPALPQNAPSPLPPNRPHGTFGAVWPGLHNETNGAATGAYQANPYRIETHGYSHTHDRGHYAAGDNAYYEQQHQEQYQQQHPMYTQLAHTRAAPPYALPVPYQPGPQSQHPWAQPAQLSQPQQHLPPQSQQFQLEGKEPHQVPAGQEARRTWQQSTAAQQPCAPPPQLPQSPQPQLPAARSSRPPVQPQSLAPVSAVFGSARFEAVMSVLRRTLTALYIRTPDIFREVYGFDLNWWISTRGKPLGEDDLLTMLPFRDYVLVVVRKYGGFTQHVSGGRKLCQLAPNPVLSALLGRSMCGHALVLRLRMDFGDPLASSSRSTSAAGNSTCSLTGEVYGGGCCDPVDHLCCVSLTAAGLRNVLLETETLAWHVEQYKAFLEDIDDNLLAEAQVGWVARLPRTPLDDRGMPNLAEALKAAATATGLAPTILAQALAALDISDDTGCDGRSSEGAFGAGGKEGSSEGAKRLSNGCTRLRGGNHRVGQSAAVPEALLPLLRCVRCSSPWCDPATSSGSRGVGACPFGHVWRSLDTDSDGDSPLPVFTAARPGVLMASTGASAATRGACQSGRTALSVRQLVPQPCGALVARLSVYWHWFRSKNLKLLVAAALDETLVEMEAAEAAQAAARALGMSAAPREVKAAARVDGCLSSSGEHSVEEPQEAELAASGPEPEGAKDHDDGKDDVKDDEDGEEKYRQAAEMLRHETWPYYISFCKGPECLQCHSGHEVRLALAVQRLLGRAVGGARNRDATGLMLSTHSSTPSSSTVGALATASQRLGFEVLAEFDEDASMKNVALETRAAAVTGTHKSTSKKAPSGPIAAKLAVLQQQQSSTRTSANDKRAPGATASHQTVSSVPAAALPVAGAVEAVQMSWADEAEAAEAEVAAAVRTATAHCSRKLLGKLRVPPVSPPVPNPPSFAKPGSERDHYTTLEGPAPCAAVPSPSTGWRYDARPLPELPDHLDDDVEAPVVAATILHDADADMDVGQAGPVADRAAVAASMATKSRNGVYVPPHLRSTAGDGVGETGLSALSCQEEEEKRAEVLEAAAGERSMTETGSGEDTVGGPYASSNLTQSLLQPPPPPPSISLEPTAVSLEPARLSGPQQGQQGPMGAPWMPSAGVPVFMPGPPYAQVQLESHLPCQQPPPPQPLLNPLSSAAQTTSAATTSWAGMPPHHLQSTGPYAAFPQGEPTGLHSQKDSTIPGDTEDDLGTLLSLLVPSAAAGPDTAGGKLYGDIQTSDAVQHGSYGGNMPETTTGAYAVQPLQQASAVQPPQHAPYPYGSPYTDPYSHTSGRAAFAPMTYGHSLPPQPPLGPHFPPLIPPQQQRQPPPPPQQLFYAQSGFEGAAQNVGTQPAALLGPAAFVPQPHQLQPPGGVWPGQLPPLLGPPVGFSTVYGDQYAPHHPMHSNNAVGGGWDGLHMS